jgi:putative transcriptional regulator
MKNRLRVLRAERGWSQADLAQRLRVSRQTVNAIENERYDPSLPLAFAIAGLFGGPIESIFDPNASKAAVRNDSGDEAPRSGNAVKQEEKGPRPGRGKAEPA